MPKPLVTLVAAATIAVLCAIPAVARVTSHAEASSTAFELSAATDNHGAVSIGSPTRGGDAGLPPVASPAVTTPPKAPPTTPPTAPPRTAPAATPAPTADPTLTPARPTRSPAPSPPPASGPFFGLLQTDGSHAAAERSAGVTTATLELGWDNYEKAPGVFDENYAATMRSRLAAMKAAGQQVVLDAGLQYPPSWIFSLDAGTRFVDQYGDVWHGQLSEDVPNAVFDRSVRAAEAAYIAHIAQDFGDAFFAVRAGGLLMNELRYPRQTYNGHTNCYWAFDGNARAASPVPGWVPGQPDSAKAAAFLSYYTQSLTDFQNWLVGTYRAHFSSWIIVLYPSWGLRPGDTDAAVASNLDGSTKPAGWGTLAMGLDWARQVGSITDPHVVVYTGWLDRGDDGSTAQTMSPVRYLLSLARGKGLPVAGENSGGNSLSDMSAVVGTVRSLGLIGMMWLSEPKLLAGDGGTSLSAYSRLIGH